MHGETWSFACSVYLAYNHADWDLYIGRLDGGAGKTDLSNNAYGEALSVSACDIKKSFSLWIINAKFGFPIPRDASLWPVFCWLYAGYYITLLFYMLKKKDVRITSVGWQATRFPLSIYRHIKPFFSNFKTNICFNNAFLWPYNKRVVFITLYRSCYFNFRMIILKLTKH